MALLINGHDCSIVFASDTSPSTEAELISFTPWGSTVAEIEQTTMQNAKYKTKSPSPLIEVTPASGTFAYAASDRSKILAFQNTNQLITVTLPDNSTDAVYGFVSAMTPGEMTSEGRPTLSLTITPTMQNAGVETNPNFA